MAATNEFLNDFKRHMNKEADPLEVLRERRLSAAQECFWEYCRLINPEFYKDDRPHLRIIADTLQALYEGRILKSGVEAWRVYSASEADAFKVAHENYSVCRQLMINIPPRHGKSYTLTLFTQWILGKSIKNKIITVSYNEILATRFSGVVRDGIDATKIDEELFIFSDVFPNVKIKDGDAAKQLWALNGTYFSYLGTGFGGTITGIGTNCGIIDDPVKNDYEAYNDNVLEKQWTWYTDTFLSRLEEGALQIINMTRWSTKDLCGRILDSEDAPEWYELKMKACLDLEKGEMLCPSLFSYNSFMRKKRMTSAGIFEANYQQEPVDIQGKLYAELKTYTELPKDRNGRLVFDKIINYTDTADTGRDFLCSINAVLYNGEAYITDVLYTDKPMAVTEPLCAKLLHNGKVNTSYIESNSGGSGFSRNVRNILWSRYMSKKTVIRSFYQSKNKQARILSNSSFVMEHVYFPVNWNVRWPEFYRAVTTYKAKGGNKNDDAPDALTGIAEHTHMGGGLEFLS